MVQDAWDNALGLRQRAWHHAHSLESRAQPASMRRAWNKASATIRLVKCRALLQRAQPVTKGQVLYNAPASKRLGNVLCLAHCAQLGTTRRHWYNQLCISCLVQRNRPGTTRLARPAQRGTGCPAWYNAPLWVLRAKLGTTYTACYNAPSVAQCAHSGYKRNSTTN